MTAIATLTHAQRQFTLNAALTKAYTRKALVNGVDVDQMVLEGIASSTARDRHGDTITALGQSSMLAKLQTGNNGAPLAMFLNHSYNVPEDVLGHCGESQLVTMDANNGSPANEIALRIVCVVTDQNPRAIMAFKIVQSGVPLGYSIGGAITDCSVDEENDDGESWCPPLLIDGIDLFEISLCGIPANPLSYTDAAKALVKDLGLPEDAPESTKDWSRAMRLGFVRSATRNVAVRAQLRKALPALHASAAAPEIVSLVCTECDWKRDVAPDLADETVREHEDDQAHVVERHVMGTTMDADDVPDGLDPAAQVVVAESIGHLKAAMTHGGCSATMDSVQKAYDCMSGMLQPGEDDPAAQNAIIPPAIAVQLTVDELTLAPMTAEQQAQIAEATSIAESIQANIVAKSAELAKVTADTAAATAELETLEAKRIGLVAETAELQKKADELKATPAGRATRAATGTADHSSTTLHEAQRKLSAAIAGTGDASNPARRPA